MLGRAVPVDGNGLAREPAQRDCIGEACKYAASEGCYIDSHHGYFDAGRFQRHSRLAATFQALPENVLPMARCAHDIQHDRYEIARIPPVVVMERFIEETQVLRLFTGSIQRASTIVSALDADHPRHWPHDMVSSKRWLERHTDVALSQVPQMRRLHIVPRPVIERQMNWGMPKIGRAILHL